jgi:type IV pilus assembly protein PilQ
MTLLNVRRRPARRLASAALTAAMAGTLVLTAAPAPIRLVGISSQASGATAAVLIEATEPVAYAVSRPDPLTLLVDLRNVSVADASNQVARGGQIAGATLEQQTALDGKSLARVRVALVSPSTYRVRSARNTIRVELEAEARSTAPEGTPIAVKEASAAASPETPNAGAAIPAATILERVRAQHTRSTTTVTLSGNGRLDPSSLAESDDQPRRLILDFPNVASKAPAQTGVDGVFVKKVRIDVNSREPLVTRVVMELSPTAAYHVERGGPDGRDIAVVFEGRKSTGAVLVAPPEVQNGSKDEEPNIPMQVALANAAALTPQDPITALDQPVTGAAAAPKTETPIATKSAARPVAPPPRAEARPAKTQAPAAPQPEAQQPPEQTTPQPSLNAQIPGTGEKKYTGNPISMDFQDADLRSVLRTFAEISGLNMVIDPQVQGRVDMVLNEVPWDQALDTILRGNKLGWTVDGTIVRIARSPSWLTSRRSSGS